MNSINSVYIVEPDNQGWIIERLMQDILHLLVTRGVKTRIGTGEDYQGEDVIFNSRYLTPFSDHRAKVNSLFITHVDDRTKEIQLKALFKGFNSLVCMSPQDAEFVAALKGSQLGIAGIDLPARDLKVRPTRIAIFSACYEDGRKNEHWITDYFQNKPATCKQNFVFCFMGWGWEKFCLTLGDLEMNFEIYRYSRFTSGEYELYKEVLPTMDVLLYLGFDGGSMSVYDAISAGIDVIAPNISYHQNLHDSVSLFDDKMGFFDAMDRLDKKIDSRKKSLQKRSIEVYVDLLQAHWCSLLHGDSLSLVCPKTTVIDTQKKELLEQYRSRYKKITLSRMRSALIRLIQALNVR